MSKLLEAKNQQILEWQDKYYDEWRLNKKLNKKIIQMGKDYDKETRHLKVRISELEGK